MTNTAAVIAILAVLIAALALAGCTPDPVPEYCRPHRTPEQVASNTTVCLACVLSCDDVAETCQVRVECDPQGTGSGIRVDVVGGGVKK